MDIKKAIKEMTLEEKASLCSGRDFWHTKAVKSRKIPEFEVSDGPHGLRRQTLKEDHTGSSESIKAVCFPAACATASSFDRNLLNKLGKALGIQCQSEGVGTILGPAVNIKRSPLCGRNFEYFSEDPLVASELSSALIKGVQSKNVGTSIKHFLANNQETRRLTMDEIIDERALREIYLASFEGAVKNAKPWTVMCSYNKVNGVHMSENRRFLTGVLRDEWGFDGVVISDWGAVNDRVAGLIAGLDLEMPGSYGINDREIVAAVRDGRISEAVLNRTVERILKLIDRFESHRSKQTKWDKDADHELAGKIEEESAVLLKNDGILPLDKNDAIAVIGKYAKTPRFQGGGSSHINSSRVTSFWDAAKGKGHEFYFAPGFDDKKDEIDRILITKAVSAAKKSDVALIFAGLPDSYESEGYDRSHMRLPECQNVLIEEVLKIQPNVVVVLTNGAPVEMPWKEDVRGIFEMYLGGQNVGSAEYNLLFGKVNPCGKLAETFPLKMEDNPSFLNFPGANDSVHYKEGIFVGYRYYDKKKMEVNFPFGHGLSYTTYKYSNLKVSKRKLKAGESLEVSVDVSNIGRMAGKEIVELYVAPRSSTVSRPVRELKGFEKVNLRAGETKTVSFVLDKRSFAWYDPSLKDWYVEPGDYDIEAAASSRDIRLTKKINIDAPKVFRKRFDENSTFSDFMGDERLEALIKPVFDSYRHVNDKTVTERSEAISQEMVDATFGPTPLRAVLGFGDGTIDHEKLKEITDKANELFGYSSAVCPNTEQ